MKLVQQTIKIQATDSISFLKLAQEVILRGARYNETTYVYVNTLPMMAEFFIEIPEDKPWTQWTDNGPGIFAIPIPVTVEKPVRLTKAELDALDWEQLKEVCKDAFGITGRDRGVLISKYLAEVAKED